MYNNCGSEELEARGYRFKIDYLPYGSSLVHFAQNAEPRTEFENALTSK